jgi:pimeloyl-ACP methyl ester carboxylesterase
MPIAEVNHRRVYYEVFGDGDPVFLLHHGFGSTKMWKNIFPRFVLAGYRVILYDRRGFGQSEAGDGFWDFYESDLCRVDSVEELGGLKQALGIGKCHLVGQCEGGVVAVDYAVKYPDEVQTLTTASTQCFSDVTMVELNAAKFPTRFAELEPELKAKMVEWQGDNAEIAYDHYTNFGGEYGKGYFDIRPVLPLVSCPSLVLYPDRSAIFDVEQAIAFFRHLPRGELAVFPKCGHNTYDQRPDDYVKTILDFIARSTGKQETCVRPAMTCLA